ncbi:hypothetical protein DPX16_2248 [Anabarilius grahami]|uniref:Uncharacterized protein n=1 Tax=Anabarilius grahami TaxID=495550 RepID=A0A3N0YRT9_ANAGA|nr:hypothetical protein DPX16_2248 [Anabarilius grahami]
MSDHRWLQCHKLSESMQLLLLSLEKLQLHHLSSGAAAVSGNVTKTKKAFINPLESYELLSAEIESTRSSIVKASSTRQPVAQFLNKPSIPA